MVVKPASQTPLSALAIGGLALEAGIPAGVVNIVTGDARAIADEIFSNPTDHRRAANQTPSSRSACPSSRSTTGSEASMETTTSYGRELERLRRGATCLPTSSSAVW
jgi:succinate-semialdehyde dehydrogenase/glutarate-semialdehyde dehydrogenase